MANKKAVYSASVACLGFVCFAVGATAVGLPMWGYFDDLENRGHDQGYFGPWRMCKKLLYNREKCGVEVARFRPSTAVYIAGVVAAIGVSVLGLFCVLSVIQLAMVASRDKVVLKYTHLVMLKMALALLATLLAIVSAGLFAIQIDEKDTQGFVITIGAAFYILILSIILNGVLFMMSIYDTLYSRREGGDPTAPQGVDTQDTTINNPGFREDTRSGVSVTNASGKPYAYNGHGSMASMNTTATTITSLSTESSIVARSPLRSSLKKPRPRNDDGTNPGLGFHNPGGRGFSGNSPTLSRNGSQKKVRIQTHSTEV